MLVYPEYVLGFLTGIFSLIAAVTTPFSARLWSESSLLAGSGAPQITVTAPVPGAVLDGESVLVAWTASDPDGDALVFRVEFSNDDGVIWRTVADDVTGSSVEIPRTRLSAGAFSRFRVWASDGVHETVDEINGTVVVVDWPPTVEITSPPARSLFIVGEPITFTGSAFDIDAGPIGGFALSWSSHLDGFLGRGNSLSVALSAGDHIVTLSTPDGKGGRVEDNVLVYVIPAELRLFLTHTYR